MSQFEMPGPDNNENTSGFGSVEDNDNPTIHSSDHNPNETEELTLENKITQKLQNGELNSPNTAKLLEAWEEENKERLYAKYRGKNEIDLLVHNEFLKIEIEFLSGILTGMHDEKKRPELIKIIEEKKDQLKNHFI